MGAADLVHALGGRMHGTGGMCRCPAHDDSTPSLSVTEHNGRVLVHCQAGCSQADVVDALATRGLKAVKRGDDTSVTAGSGNIFADLGIPDADTELLKAQLTLQIHTIIKQRGLTQTHAGEVLGIQQPHVSLLMRNRSGTFSVGRLMEFLAALGQDVEITVRPTRRAQGALSVVTAHPRRKGMPATP